MGILGIHRQCDVARDTMRTKETKETRKQEGPTILPPFSNKYWKSKGRAWRAMRKVSQIAPNCHLKKCEVQLKHNPPENRISIRQEDLNFQDCASAPNRPALWPEDMGNANALTSVSALCSTLNLRALRMGIC